MTSIISAILLLSQFTFANPSCPTTKPKLTDAIKAACDEALPECIPDAKFNADLMKDISDDELFTRLIMAESLASTCVPGKSEDEIYEGIAWTLKNRVNRKDYYGNKTARGIVLKPSQFSSSTGSCDVAKRKEFLCPTSYKNFDEAWIKASKAWKKTKTEKNPMPSVRHYFFPKHFDNSEGCKKWKGVLPTWATKENTIKEVNTCVTFHNVKE